MTRTYDVPMLSTRSWPLAFGRKVEAWAVPWWRIVHLGLLVLALIVSKSSYRMPRRRRVARQVVAATAPVLLWFTAFSALASIVITRIVLVTAVSYGLSQYALEMVVRVLVVELMPLTACLFVALRWSIPAGAELAAMRRSGELDGLRAAGMDALRDEIMPRAVAGIFATSMLVMVSGVLCLVIAYVMAHGLSPWGFEAYTRMVGRVFTPTVTLILVLKSLALTLAVTLIPIGSALHDRAAARGPAGTELAGMARLSAVVLLVEVASLAGNYF